jgi:hypothetical protein
LEFTPEHINKAIEIIATATPPTLMALAAWRSARKNTRIATAARIGQSNTAKRVEDVHQIVDGQRDKILAETSSLREEVKALREEIGGLKQEVVQLKRQVLGER